jgi:hypothetical protein
MFPTMHLRLCSFKCNGKVFPVHSMKAYEIWDRTDREPTYTLCMK